MEKTNKTPLKIIMQSKSKRQILGDRKKGGRVRSRKSEGQKEKGQRRGREGEKRARKERRREGERGDRGRKEAERRKGGKEV